MAEVDCRPQVHGCAVRLARLDATGAPLVGATNLYVTDQLITMTATPVYADGDEIEDKTACGTVGLQYRAPDTFKRYDISIELLYPDPFLESMMGGESLTVAGRPLGAAAPPIGPITGDGVSIEVWAKRIDDGDVDALWPYAHWAYPKVRNLRKAPHSHANAGLRSTWTGQAFENALWGNGPNNDFGADSDRVWQWIPSDAIPAATCALGAVLADGP